MKCRLSEATTRASGSQNGDADKSLPASGLSQVSFLSPCFLTSGQHFTHMLRIGSVDSMSDQTKNYGDAELIWLPDESRESEFAPPRLADVFVSLDC